MGRGLGYQGADRVVATQVSPDLLEDQVRRLGPEHGAGSALVGLELIEGQLDLPPLGVGSGEVDHGRLAGPGTDEKRTDYMVDVDAVLDEAGLTNTPVREYVRYWAELTAAERVEVIGANDDSRLIAESLAAGEIQPAGAGACQMVGSGALSVVGRACRPLARDHLLMKIGHD
jgi:hypothetical protein